MTSIKDLKPDHRNARKRTDRSASLIAESLKRFGAARSIVIDEDNRILAGNGTVEGAKAAGIQNIRVIETDGTEIIAVKRTGLSEDDKIGLALADNRTSDLSDWDKDMLQQLSAEHDLAPWFEADDLAEIIGEAEQLPTEGLTDADDVPEAPEEPITKPGDVWLLGKHRVMCGDSTDVLAVEKLMAGGKADMVFTDPPYGIGLDTEGQTLGKSQPYGAVLNDHDTTVAVDAFNLAQTICDGPLFFWGANHYSHALPGSPCWIVWDKQGGKHVTFADVELCYTSIDAPARLFTHIWDGFRRDSEKGEKRVHPTQKPVQLIVELWEFFKKHISGALVLDLFGGSGSTLIACEKTGRQARLMELDPKYCDVIVKRWEQFTGNKAMLELISEAF
jgi:16S rRNA G966 N2-methylase RsmD